MIDIKIQPIADLVKAVLRVPEPALDAEARQIVEEIYTQVFHKGGVEKSTNRAPHSPASSSGTQSPGSSPALKPQKAPEMVVEDITDVAQLGL